MSLFVVNSSVSPPPAGTASVSAAMLDAVIPSTLARVSVTQQSPQQLSLRLPGGSQVTLDTSRLPETTTKQHYRMASLPGTNQTAALFGASQGAQSVAVSDDQLNRLTDQLSRLYTSAANAQLSVKAQVTAVRPDAISLQLNNGQTLTLPVRLSPSHMGEQVSVDLTRQDGKTTLSINGATTQRSLAATLTSPDKSVVREVVSGALRNAGVRLDAKALASLPDVVAPLVPKGAGQPIQHQVTIAERGGTLTVQSAMLQAIGRFTVPTSVAAEPVGQISGKLINPSALNRLPMLNASDAATTTATRPQAQAGGLSAQQRSEVHQQIITLSRQLLSESGSTRTALNQLLSTLDMPAKGVSPATQALLTTMQARVRGLEQGITFSSFTPQLKTDSGASAAASPGTTSASTAQAGSLLGNMAQRMKDIAALLSQPAASQDASEAAAQTKPVSAAAPLSQPPGEQVKALLNATPLPLSQAVLSRPAGGNDLVGALVTMLQFSLAGRAINRQPSLARQADRSDSVLAKSLAGSTRGLSGSPARVAQDLSQMDSRGALVQSLKTLLSSHQHASLTNADNRLQGQDSLYYMLPTTSATSAPPELLIRRDPSGSQHGGEQQATTRNWHLTMKLDIGEKGELLAKSRICGETIELDLYASSDSLLHMVADTLPFFTRKLEANGLEVARTSFQRGKVPGTLRDQPHHIFETMV